MRLPKKEYLTFDELTFEWKCSKSELFHLVATDKITPSIYLSSDECFVHEMQVIDGARKSFIVCRDGERRDLTQHPPRIFANEEWRYETRMLKGFYYLHSRKPWSNIYNLSFFHASIKREIEYHDSTYEFFEIPMACIQFDVEDKEVRVTNNIVFLRAEIDRFEREYMQNQPEKNDHQKSNDSLDGKGRTTALKLIGGLVMDAYGMDIHANRLMGVSDLVSNLAGKGISLTEETVSNWIKEAAQVIDKPKS